MLYKLTTKDIREDNDNIDVIPEFAKLSSRELKYIALVYDFDTPLGQLKLEDRKERACELAGYKRESPSRMDKTARKIMGANGGLKTANAAIPVYNSLQRDLNKEALIAFDNNLSDWITKLSEKKTGYEKGDWDTNAKLTEKYTKMLEDRKKILEIIGNRVDFDTPTLGVIEDKEDQEELSALDKRNQLKIDGK